MKCVFILFSLLCLGLAQAEVFLPRHGLPPADPPNPRARAAVWGNIVQKLDHFDQNNQKTWNMRYIYNNQFWRPGGPIFIMVGAEWTIDEGWVQSGNMYDMAQEHGGYMFYTEHRYYGKSFPTSDLSPANLKYLTTDLALADVAYFIQYMKYVMPDLANSKVVIVGGSYGGNMAIWMREKYPQLVHAAVSSSAPVFAKVDFSEYQDVVAQALGPYCSSIISTAVDQIRNYLQSSSGISKVQKDYNTCRPINVNSLYDYSYFFMTISGTIAGQIQYADASTVNRICGVLENTALGTEYDRLAKLVETQYCKSGYQDLVNSMISWDLNRGDSRQWIYQTCTQYGYYQTSPTENNLYRNTIPVDFFYRWCTDFYGPTFTSQVTHDGVARTNANYGGYNPQTTRVISIHGTVDPWHALGLKKDVNEDMPVIIVSGTSHCADLGSISPYDSPEMQNTKKLVKDYIRYWLSLD